MTRLGQLADRLRGAGLLYLVHRQTGEITAVNLAKYSLMSAREVEQYVPSFDPEFARERSESIKRRRPPAN